MAKRKSDGDALVPHKKAKLHQVIHDDHNSNTHTLHSPYPPPLTLAGPERREKRRRTLDSQSDTFEESETKRARRSPSPESPDTSSKPWASIGYDPDEEPNLWDQWQEFYEESRTEAEEFHKKYDSNPSTDHQNPLPSPEPSDRDTTESNEWKFTAIDSIQARRSTTKTSRLPSHQRFRKCGMVSSRRKRRQPPKKGKGEKKRNKSRDEALSPAVKAFLNSKRSSRRGPNCKLWHLGDDDTACTVSR